MRRHRVLSLWIVIVLVGLGCASTREPRIEAMVRSAASSDDHWKIAGYYRAEAAAARKESAGHRRLADVYGARQNWGQPFALRATDHCIDLAASADELAAGYELLAAEHERIAQE